MPQILKFSNSQEAYEKLNQYFLNETQDIIKNGGEIVSGQTVSFDTLVQIERAWVLPYFDFGNTFGYRDQKWNTLVNNYVDNDSLLNLKAEVDKKESKYSRHYNLSMSFSNKHGHGKNCLLSLTITRRHKEERPIISFTMRSSEITKRLLLDFLLVQRIGEFIYGDEPFRLSMLAINMYQDPEAFCMLDSYKPIKKMIIKKKYKKSWYQKKIMKILKRLKTVDIETVKYKVHKRCVRQLQRPNGIPLSGDRPMYAKDLKLKIKQ